MVNTIQVSTTDLGLRASIFKIGKKYILIRSAGTIGPTFITENIPGFIGGYQVCQGYKFLVALANRESRDTIGLVLLLHIPTGKPMIVPGF